MNERLSSAVGPIDTHWAIEPKWATRALARLDQIDLMTHVAEWKEREARRSPSDDEAEGKPYLVQDGIAIISLTGPMTKRGTSWGDGASTVQTRRAIRLAANDREISAIMLVIDSPGGQVSGTADLAQDVREADLKKPVMAYIEDMGCSAAYWTGSQAYSIWANRTATIGSIGVVMSLRDYSRYLENEGIKTHVISTGPYKGAGTPGAPVSSEHLADFQREVDEIHTEFVSAVAKGRKMTTEQVRELADGRVHIARQAKKMGLIDGIGSLDAALSELRKTAALRGREGKGMSDNPGRKNSFLAWLQGDDDDEEPTNTRRIRGNRDRDPEERDTQLSQLRADSTDLKKQIGERDAQLAEKDKQIATLTAEKTDLTARAALGDKYVAENRERVKKMAVVALGQNEGAKAVAVIDSADLSTLQILEASYRRTSDALGLTKNLERPLRQTLPTNTPHAAEPPSGQAPEKDAADLYISSAYRLPGKKGSN